MLYNMDQDNITLANVPADFIDTLSDELVTKFMWDHNIGKGDPDRIKMAERIIKNTLAELKIQDRPLRHGRWVDIVDKLKPDFQCRKGCKDASCIEEVRNAHELTLFCQRPKVEKAHM